MFSDQIGMDKREECVGQQAPGLLHRAPKFPGQTLGWRRGSKPPTQSPRTPSFSGGPLPTPMTKPSFEQPCQKQQRASPEWCPEQEITRSSSHTELCLPSSRQTTVFLLVAFLTLFPDPEISPSHPK